MIPKWVACGKYFKEFKYGVVELVGSSWGIFPKYIVGSQYFTLTKVKPNDYNAETFTTFLGWIMRVQVDRLSHSCAKTQLNLFYGKLDHLFFDLAH